jgi:hypothetical protein
MIHRLLLLCCLSVLVSSCSKDEIIVPDNIAPPDGTISTLVLENYVTKAYIALLGRKPTDAEETEAVALLRSTDLDGASRTAMLTSIMALPEYREKIVETTAFKLLNNYDTAAAANQIEIYDNLLSNPDFMDYWDEIQAERLRMVQLQEAHDLFISGQISLIELRRRMINNDFYDQINMGTENYVRSTFNHFFGRNPTTAELEEGKNMVDGEEGVLFGQLAQYKDGYNAVILGADEYYAGQVNELFVRYLFRSPDTEESVHFAELYRTTADFDRLQRDILSLDEYIGL